MVMSGVWAATGGPRQQVIVAVRTAVRAAAQGAGMNPSPSHRSTANPTARRRVAARLNAEWERLVTHRRTNVVPAAWRHEQELAPYPTLAELLAATGRDGGLDDAAADRLLAVVVACAATDELAARLVLQRVTAGLVLTAIRRSARGAWDLQELFDDLVGHAWTVIRTYPLDRRPTKIAVNILRDAEYLSCVRPFRLRRVIEEATPTAALAIPPATLDGRACDRPREPADEIAEVFAELRRSGLAAADLRLLWRIHVDGTDVTRVADELDVCERTVRNRRAAAVARAGRLLAA
jgi:hypothetical protein